MIGRADVLWVAVRAQVLVAVLLAFCAGRSTVVANDQKAGKPHRPELPWGVTGLNPIQTGAYDSKAQAPAEALGALNEMTLRGWDVIWKYYPQLGIKTEEGAASVNPSDPADRRFYAVFSNEDPGRSPIPLISMICSLEPRDATGRLKALRDELLAGIKVDDYASWSVDRLRLGVRELTQETSTPKGVKYRTPKKPLTFNETVRLYAMTVELIARDDKWVKWQGEVKRLGYSVPTMPDFQDFAKRLNHQLPIMIPPGGTRGFLLYRAGWDIAQPVTKQEYEERMDVVLVTRTGTTFHVEQFPVYLTNDQAAWNPAWIEPRDEVKDTTILGRKFEQQWTRFDGPYLWPKRDQLNGEANYRATVQFKKDAILIEGERYVPRRGAVVKTARDLSYDPTNMKRFAAGDELPPEALIADLPELPDTTDLWRMASRNIDSAVYAQGNRQLLWYKTGEGAWSSAIIPRSDAGQAVLKPIRPVTAPSGGIVARFTGTGAERPDEVEVLDDEQKVSVNLAVALMNRCLENVGEAESNEIRVAMPRDAENHTPIFFYAVRNGTAVRRSPTFEVVVLSTGYYNSYVSAFNRLLWVLEKPIAEDAAKVAALHKAIGEYLCSGFPKDGESAADPALTAWSQILRDNQVEQLFNASILPGAVKPAPASIMAEAGPRNGGPKTQAGDWLLASAADSSLDAASQKNAAIALGLMNLYLSEAAAEQWKKWYPRGTTVGFRVAGEAAPGSAKQEVRETTAGDGAKYSEVDVTVELPLRAYADYSTTLVWVLGVLDVNARARDKIDPVSTGGQESGVVSVLEFLRQVDVQKDASANQALTQLGVDSKRFQMSIPDVPPMFLGQEHGELVTPTERASLQQDMGSGQRPVIALQFPREVGMGVLPDEQQSLVNEAARVMNLYFAKNEAMRDSAAGAFRKTLPPATRIHVYRNSTEAINRKQEGAGDLYMGVPDGFDTCAKWFVALLRVLEMQNIHLTKSPAEREDIARSIHEFLREYGKDHPQDSTATELKTLTVKTMTELW